MVIVRLLQNVRMAVLHLSFPTSLVYIAMVLSKIVLLLQNVKRTFSVQVLPSKTCLAVNINFFFCSYSPNHALCSALHPLPGMNFCSLACSNNLLVHCHKISVSIVLDRDSTLHFHPHSTKSNRHCVACSPAKPCMLGTVSA